MFVSRNWPLLQHTRLVFISYRIVSLIRTWFICLRETGCVIGNVHILSAFWHKRRKGESVKDKEKEITSQPCGVRDRLHFVRSYSHFSSSFSIRATRKIVAISGSWPSLLAIAYSLSRPPTRLNTVASRRDLLFFTNTANARCRYVLWSFTTNQEMWHACISMTNSIAMAITRNNRSFFPVYVIFLYTHCSFDNQKITFPSQTMIGI